jgi:outer membrane receptor protein involved in Fe transport
MFSSIYDYSKLRYTSRRMNSAGVLTREIIPNQNLGLERKTTINAGLDLSIFRQLINVHLDVYQSNVDNLVIQQSLPVTYGYTNYFDNGGKLETRGVELAADTRMIAGDFVWTFGAAVNTGKTTIKELSFLDSDTHFIVTPVEGAAYITSTGNPINAFYGFKTNGITHRSRMQA